MTFLIYKITGKIYEVYAIRSEDSTFPIYAENEKFIVYKSEKFIFFFIYGYERKNNWD